MNAITLLIAIFSGLLISVPGCKPNAEKAIPVTVSIEKIQKDAKPLCIPPVRDTTLKVGNHLVDIRVPPDSTKADLLILPGWNFSRTDWCGKADLCEMALKRGFRLILPEMGKSIYAGEIYPETRKDWQKFPTGKWLSDTLIPLLQKDFCILDSSGVNYVLGLSTGGRGSVLTALRGKDLFNACAALSGDFDQTLMQNDNLMKGWYGEFSKFPDRWKGADNPAAMAANFRVPIYLGHGKMDKVVPVSQTEAFFKALTLADPELPVMLNLPENAGHDYEYWGSETDAVLDFFEKFQKPVPGKER